MPHLFVWFLVFLNIQQQNRGADSTHGWQVAPLAINRPDYPPASFFSCGEDGEGKPEALEGSVSSLKMGRAPKGKVCLPTESIFRCELLVWGVLYIL